MSLCPPVRRTFSDECGPGTFHSLGALPRRPRDSSPRKPRAFDIAHDDDDDHSSTPTSPPRGVHFPSSPTASPPPAPPSSPAIPRLIPPCPQLSRGVSTPIHLSNGKPLKPSLKSSSSSPAMLISPHMHHRTHSEPSTPSTTKNVHFPEKDYGLATICIYNRSARPAALSSPTDGNGDDTETEGEDSPSTCFPFPSFPPVFNYEIDPTKSSSVPCKSPLPANLFLESLNTSPSPPFSSASSKTKPSLTGSVLVRNLAFEKHVVTRFTLDNWQTVSEVGAHYISSLSLPPSQFPISPSPEETRGRGWDRFTFTIHLEDYATSLSTRKLWLAVRYGINSTYPEPSSSEYGPGGEWWDNNGGENYCVGFRPAIVTPGFCRSKHRRETFSVPISPTTCKEHALGFMFSSVPNKDGHSTPLRAGKLNLANYVPPTVRATPRISHPSAGPVLTSSPSSHTSTASSTLATLQSSSDEESASPASSTLSTPTASPTIVPRAIIGGQFATSAYDSGEKCDEDIATHSKPGRIGDWDWSASSKLRSEGPSRQDVDHVPGLEPPGRWCDIISSPSGRRAVYEGSSPYEVFIEQWCFTQGPPSNHHAYDGAIVT